MTGSVVSARATAAARPGNVNGFRSGATMRAAAALAAVLAAPGLPLHAQDADTAVNRRPYSTLSVSASGARAATSGRLDDFWEAGPGAQVTIHTPFHVGELGASLMSLRYRPKGTQPAFRAYVIGLEWRLGLPSAGRIRPTVALAAGDFLTTFDGVETKGLAKESEIFAGGTAALALRLARGTEATLGVTGMQVLTSTPIRLAFVTAGISQTVGTPRWLRGVIE